jgi:hypothetical protein
MFKRGSLIVVAAMLVMLAATGQVEAQTDKQEYEGRILTDKLTIRLGGLAENFTTDLAAGNVLGISIRLEDVLGFEEELETGSISGFYRLGTKNKHGIGFGIAAFERSTSGIIQGTIPIFDEEFVGAFASTFDVRIFNFDYRYSFVNTGKTEAGFVAGLSTYQFDFTLDGMVQIGGDPTMLEARAEKADFLAPLPTFGFFVNYAIKPKLIVGFNTGALDLDFGDVSGRVLNTKVDFSWYFSKYVGVGLALTSSNITYDNSDDKSGDRLKIDYKQKGTTLFFVFGF